MSPTDDIWLNDEFKAVRDDFLKHVKNPGKHDFTKLTTAKDVWDATDEIQKQQSKTKTLRGLHRIRPFLEALDQFSGTIEVFLQVKPDILALIWGPVKFLLQISSALSSAFEKVVQVLGEIGEVLPLFNNYASLFKNNQTVKHVLRLFYTEILEFYKILLNFMNDRRLKTCLEPFWPSVRSRIAVVEDNIKRHKSLLTDHVMLEHILQSDKSRQRALQEYARNEESRTEQGFAAALAEFKPPMYHGKLAEILQSSSIESGHWLSTHNDYNGWVEAKDTSRRCIWLQGIPGSGKTFLVANTIQRMQRSSSDQVVFLFLTHDDQTRGQILEVFTSILFQAARNDGSLKSTLLEEIRSNGGRLSSSIDIQKTTLDLLSSCGPVSVVIDGVDEVEEHSRKPLLGALLKLLGSTDNIKLLVSSRAESDIAKTLRDKAVPIRIDVHNQDDIRRFIESEGKTWIDDLKELEADNAMLAASKESLERVHQKSEGMFLYSKLVLQLLRAQGTAADIQAELKSLPDGLDQAYDRILTRINTKLVPAQKTLAHKVLGWVACALRPLRREELLQILVVEPGATEFRKGNRFHADINSACGPIIEIVDDVVRFVHFSAKEYITDPRTGFLELENAALDAAVTCSSYLCHTSLDVLFEATPSTVGATIKQNILSKDYVLFEYAANMWLQHLSEIRTSVAIAESGLNDILAKLLGDRDMNLPEEIDPPTSMLERFHLFKNEGELQRMLAYSYKVQGQLRYGQSREELEQTASSSIAFRLLGALHAFREHIEDLYCGNISHLDGCQCPEPLCTYGLPTFFCQKPFCPMFKDGYSSPLPRDKHTAIHKRDYKCPYPGCFYFKDGFYTQASLSSHEKAIHNQDMANKHTNDEVFPDTALGSIDDDNLALILHDAIINSNLDTISTLLNLRPQLGKVISIKSMLPNMSAWEKEHKITKWGDFDYCLCLAAGRSTTEVLRFLVDRNARGPGKDQLLLQALATAIETKNRPNIKHLLSFSPCLTKDVDLPRPFEKIILDKRRSQPDGNSSYQPYISRDIVSRSLSLWDPGLMEFLMNECSFHIPPGSNSSGGLFSRPAIEELGFEEVRDRFEQMRKYVTDSKVFADGVLRSVASWSPSALRICLENGGDPNTDARSTSAFVTNPLAWHWEKKDRRAKEMMCLLLKHGSSEVPINHNGSAKKGYRESFERSNGISWDDFVQKARSGEDFDMIIPNKRRAKG